MGFGQAVATVFANYFNFSGRSGRPEYWWFVLFSVIASAVATAIDHFALGYGWLDGIGPVDLAFLAVTIIPSLAVSVRRLHDIGRSGWWLLILFIPIVGFIILIVWACKKGETGANQYGALQPA